MSIDEATSDQYDELRAEVIFDLTAALTAAADDPRSHCLALMRSHEAALRALESELDLRFDRAFSVYDELKRSWTTDPGCTPTVALEFRDLLKRQDVLHHDHERCDGCDACTAQDAFDERFMYSEPIELLVDDALNTALGNHAGWHGEQVERLVDGVEALLDDVGRARVLGAVHATIGGAA